MQNTQKVAVVIPCYNVSREIEDVLERIPDEVNAIYVVDDACPRQSGKIAEEKARSDPRIQVIFHERNQGVGGAVITGFKQALAQEADIIVKLDGDGQMPPELIPALIQPIVEGRADFVKGNRFAHLKALQSMPAIRLFGNSILSFWLKMASGYWNLMDPTNGFIAIQRNTLQEIELSALNRGYFFESDLLCKLYLVSAVVKELPMKALYNGEESSLSLFVPRSIFRGH